MGKPDRYVFLPHRVEFGRSANANQVGLGVVSKSHIKRIFGAEVLEPAQYRILKVNPGNNQYEEGKEAKFMLINCAISHLIKLFLFVPLFLYSSKCGSS